MRAKNKIKGKNKFKIKILFLNASLLIENGFKYLFKNPRKYINKDLFKNENKERVIADFIAGMTDRYAINLHKKIK